jgi:predicted nucleic acid-binding protein
LHHGHDELAFIRIGTQARYFADLTEARAALTLMLASSRGRIGFLADDLGASTLPSYVKHPRDTTDGHLLALAERHNLRLLTLDKRIPGELVIS